MPPPITPPRSSARRWRSVATMPSAGALDATKVRARPRQPHCRLASKNSTDATANPSLWSVGALVGSMPTGWRRRRPIWFTVSPRLAARSEAATDHRGPSACLPPPYTPATIVLCPGVGRCSTLDSLGTRTLRSGAHISHSASTQPSCSSSMTESNRSRGRGGRSIPPSFSVLRFPQRLIMTRRRHDISEIAASKVWTVPRA